MNKILALMLIGMFLIACTKVDLSKKTASIKIAEENISKSNDKDKTISIYNITHDATSKIGEKLRIDERYETPSIIIERVDNEIEVESFGEVI